jgi:predicted acetyltransferase
MEIRPVADREELRAGLVAIGQYGGWHPTDEELERWERLMELERMRVALDDGQVVGGAGAFSFELTIPGATMPCAGVTVVGVYPTHRRRGVLTEMMRVQLDEVRERGEPIAALWSSEERIYGRFGYGMASLQGEIALDRGHAGFALPYEPVGRVRLVEREEAQELFPPVWDAARTATPGCFARPPAWWEQRILYDPPESRQGAGPKRFVVHETDGSVDGYAFYRHKGAWEEGVAVGRLLVREVIATTPQATRELWRYLLDIDQVQTISGHLLPTDHPLFLLLAEPRRAKYRVGDGIWVRLVDVGAALSGRGYAADGRVVFDVRDEFCPWNEGRWGLEDGEAARTEDEPDLRLDVTALGSVFLGGFTFAELHRACRIEEATEGAVARADAMFRTDVRPWCPEIF